MGSSTERVRQTPNSPNDETDYSKGRVRETPHPPNDEAERTHRFRHKEKLPTNPKLDSYWHGACKRDPLPDDQQDRFQHAVC